jgi:ABC-2 type transport system ATP-binding protein
LILTTHYMEEAEKLCDYIIIIDHGVILNQGTLDELLSSQENLKIVEFTLKNQLTDTSILENDCSFKISWDSTLQRGRLEMSKLEKELPTFLSFLRKENLQLHDMITRQTSLDDLFISLTGRHLDD